MIGPKFLPPEDRRELLAYGKHQRGDHGIARRANALLLLDDGKSRAEIAGVLYLDDDTVRGWRKQYLAEGWDAVAHDGWKGGQSRMTGAQEAGPCNWLEGRICRSAPARTKNSIMNGHSICSISWKARVWCLAKFTTVKPATIPQAGGKPPATRPNPAQTKPPPMASD